MPPRPSSFMEALHGSSSSEYGTLCPMLNEGSSEEQDATTKSSEREHSTSTRKRSARRLLTADKKRKTTYDVRREQKVELTGLVEKLQRQLDELKYRVLMEQGEAAKSNERVATGNVNSALLQPAQSIIRLGVDRTERHKTLVALKVRKLREAKRFIMARGQGLDPRSTFVQEDRNHSPDEDFSITRFENTAIHGATAREVFDAFIDVAQNAEIIISEMFGSITIRENTDADTRDISQMRLVTSTSQGTLVESNTIMFTEFVEAKDDIEESCGVIVADFVDSDELYPYKPKERARRDTVTVFMIRSFVPPASLSENSNSKTKEIPQTREKKERVVQQSLTLLQLAQTVIRLGTDPAERNDTLRALKERQLNAAERYLSARSRGLDPRSAYCQEERLDSDEGAYCILRFETLPVYRASAREVFDAIIHSVLNAELFLSEMFGCVAIREDSDFETSEFAQVRLVTLTSPGTTVESNTLLFSRFVDDTSGNGSYGVMSSDFVDFDELHPYRTTERVRRDTTTLVTVRAMPRTDAISPDAIITRWTCLKIHHTSKNISKDPEKELQESSLCWGNTAQKCVQQQLVQATTVSAF
ncbi:unnamed protein product [Phytophthora fragariaefolia]|uniref:Unnamed protein product n=1 Tax=Phytophthora fragariaefolia TaxID=1490495 RepID=A0A9W6Y067_9STRA|nr:unnamed protein product [Phytophthora fragariaefolia]